MDVAALITWFSTVTLGLTLLTIWLIEYDRDFQHAVETRLPIPVISLHALLAVGGLGIWAVYLVDDSPRLAWTAVAILGVVACLGLIMAARWIPVRRAVVAARRGSGTGPSLASLEYTLPAERNFPLPIVMTHGLLAAATITLVLLSVLGGS